MKKFFLAAILTGAGSLAFSQDDVANAKWATQPVVVDGNANEWHLPLNFYDSETKLLFAMSNDSTNIYLCFEAKDEATERQIMRAGMSIELFTKGRDKHDATITYPLAPKDRTQSSDADNNETTPPANTDNSSGTSTVNPANDGTGYHRQDPTIMRQRFLTNNITMNLAGFAITNGMIPIRGKAVNVAINWDNTDDMFYEVSIPLKEFFGDGYTTDDIAKEITMHVHVNAAQAGAAPRGGAGDGSGFSGGNGMGGMGGGMRGMGGMGGGMGGRGMRGGGMRGMGGGSSQSTAFKQKFVLATSAASNAQ